MSLEVTDSSAARHDHSAVLVQFIGGGRAMIIYSDGPLWVRILIASGATVLFVVLAWRYYVQFWKR